MSTGEINKLDNINRIGMDCCGCEACYAVCPRDAIYTERGLRGELLYKASDTLCIHCGKCIRVCAANNAKYNPAVNSFFRAKSRNVSVLKKSSSGGVAFEIASKILSGGGYVYGAVWDVDNQKVQHIRISMTEYLPAIQGSKYVHSSISREVFQSIIRDVKTNKVLFIGTPCQVSAVRNIVGENDNLFCIDLVCHGVPSGEMLEKQLKKITDENIIELSFRRGTQFILELKDEKGTIYSRDGYDNPYYALFLMFASLRESCYHCRYAQRSRVGDLTIGDYMEGGKGYSCVLANAEKGVLLKSLTESVIEYKERSVNALMDNVALNHPTARDTRVDAFTKRYNEHGLFHAYYRTFYKLALKRSLRHLFGDKIYYGIVKRFKSEP